MDEQSDYEALLDDETVTGVKERREAIGQAIDTLLGKINQIQAQRLELDKKDEELYGIVRQLDAAYARLARGKKHTEKMKKRVVRRFWSDATHEWVERFLYEWARKQLIDGPKSIGDFHSTNSTHLAVLDAISVMKHNPDVFEDQKSTKPKVKHFRAGREWLLKDGPAKHSRAFYSPHWDVEAAMAAAGRERIQTLSERMHEMLEEAIKAFYAKQYTSVIHAFSDMFWKDFARSIWYYRSRVTTLEAEIAKLKPVTPSSKPEDEKSSQ
jgi:hypothetical protein